MSWTIIAIAVVSLLFLAWVFWFVVLRHQDPLLNKKGCHFDDPGNSSPWDKERK